MPADERVRPTLGRFGVQLPPHFAHLLARLIQGGGVVDYVGGGFDFLFFRELRGHAAGYFFAGGFEVELLAGGEASYALGFGAFHND